MEREQIIVNLIGRRQSHLVTAWREGWMQSTCRRHAGRRGDSWDMAELYRAGARGKPLGRFRRRCWQLL
jgi:hypothetical protein